MMTLNTQNKSFLELKDELVGEIAQLDIELTNLQEKTATLNKMAEVVVNLQSENQDTKQLAKYECSKMNLSQNVTIGQIESEIEMIQNQLDNKIEVYEGLVNNLDTLIKILSKQNCVSTLKASSKIFE